MPPNITAVTTPRVGSAQNAVPISRRVVRDAGWPNNKQIVIGTTTSSMAIETKLIDPATATVSGMDLKWIASHPPMIDSAGSVKRIQVGIADLAVAPNA
jgi:hypothetical protein